MMTRILPIVGLLICAAVVFLTSCATTTGPVADLNDLQQGKTTKAEMENAFGAPWEVSPKGVYLWIVTRNGSDGWRTTINTYRIYATFTNEVLAGIGVNKSERSMQVLSAPGPKKQ